MLTINLLYVCTFLAIYHQTKRGLPTWEGIHTDLLEGLLFCAPGFIASVIYTRSVKRGA